MGFSLLLLGAMPLGEVFFVSPTGDDAAAGTIDAPWKTLAQAQTMLRWNANATGVVLRGGLLMLEYRQSPDLGAALVAQNSIPVP